MIFVAAAHAGDVKETGRYNLAPIPHMATAPKIDGEVGKAEWYGATLLPRLIDATDGQIAALRSRVYVAYDDMNLYVAFQIDRPAAALLPVESDTFQLSLDPAHEHKAVSAFAGNVAGPAEVFAGYSGEKGGTLTGAHQIINGRFGKAIQLWGE